MQVVMLGKEAQLVLLLVALKAELRVLNMWEIKTPSEQSLLSGMPFCIDTLSFTQWLQFVFIKKIQVLLNASHALPTAMSITPMAMEYFKKINRPCAKLIVLLVQIDKCINENETC